MNLEIWLGLLPYLANELARFKNQITDKIGEIDVGIVRFLLTSEEEEVDRLVESVFVNYDTVGLGCTALKDETFYY